MAGATPHLRNFSSRRALPLDGRRLSWPKWLEVVYPRTVTHLSTNRVDSTYSNFFDVTNAIAAVYAKPPLVCCSLRMALQCYFSVKGPLCVVSD